MYFIYCFNEQSETAEERKARGHPIGQPCVFQAMGGLTGFSSLLPGMARMDPSGAGGQLTEAELNAPITAEDHPFLRAHAALLEAYQRSQQSSEIKSQSYLPFNAEIMVALHIKLYVRTTRVSGYYNTLF